jgi:bis(5'-nucleosidyl)-tetraphosphatase
MEHPRRWDLPKGHVDPGETDEQCALRELREETAIGSDDIVIDAQFRFKEEYEVCYRGQQPAWKTLVIFLAELTTNRELVVTEHRGFRWFDWSPPHQLQTKTVDPLLEAVANHWAS